MGKIITVKVRDNKTGKISDVPLSWPTLPVRILEGKITIIEEEKDG